MEARMSQPVEEEERKNLYQHILHPLREELVEGKNNEGAIAYNVKAITRLFYGIALEESLASKFDINGDFLDYISMHNGEESRLPYTGFCYQRGNFLLHLIESSNENILVYLEHMYEELKKPGSVYKSITVVSLSDENPSRLFELHLHDVGLHSGGSVFIETDKSDVQIHDRVWDIYMMLVTGAEQLRDTISERNRKEGARKMASFVILSQDDPYILTCNKFMSLKEAVELYCDNLENLMEEELEYPCHHHFSSYLQYYDGGVNNIKDFN